LTHIDDTRTHAHTHLKDNFENEMSDLIIITLYYKFTQVVPK